MYAVIAGGGDIGGRLAGALAGGGHEVFVVDVDPVVVNDLRNRLGAVAEQGDASRVAALESAGVSRSDLFLAATASDDINLAACQIAKLRFGAPRTVAVVRDPENAPLFEAAGVDQIISQTDIVFSHLANLLPAHPLIRLMPIPGRQQELVSVKVPRNGTVVGKPLKELNLPYGCLLTLVIDSNGQVKLPADEMIVNAGDEVVLVSPVESTESILEIVTEQA